MKSLINKLGGPKTLIGVAIVAIIIFLVVMGGTDSSVVTEGHGHTH